MRAELAIPVRHLRVVRPGELSPAATRDQAERSIRRLLRTLMVSVAALTVLGLVMVLSASSVSAFAQYGSSFLFFKRQLLYAVMGGLAALLASRMRYQVWQRAWMPLLAATLMLLVLVLHSSAGVVAGGAARWISVAGFSLQPSEIAKFAAIAGTAAILSRNLRYLEEPIRWIVPIVLVVGSMTGLIVIQPDLGTAMVVATSVLVLLFVAGVRIRFLVSSAMFVGSIGLALIMGHRYSHGRFLCFLHPWADALTRQTCGYQIVQSLVALGSGHLFGVGLGASRQKWMYVPNAHTDFIFSILGEELGLIGELVVLALFGVIVYSGIRIAMRSPDAFGRLLAAGITAWLGLQTLINLGAVTGLLPITGVPLPFLSFGGSSLVMSLVGVGVLLSIGRAELAAAGRAPSTGSKGRSGR